MGTNADAGDVLQYIYLNRGEPLTDEVIADASGLSLQEVQDALDELEDRLLVTLGIEDDGDVEMTEEGRATIEDTGAFQSEFGTALDLAEIVHDWDAAD
ncbi:MAG: hypothetical protein SVW77_01160 [Candidatus Nanohaloarchaea archaeon]|nr:hypothetical protein [Candidatus Nanohaloarchaea archaeon]